jgi:hypothetical protein
VFAFLILKSLDSHRTPVTTPLLQTGIYTVSEASRLTAVSPQRIRRWLKGYEFPVKHGRHRSPAVWNGQLGPIDHTIALGFLDLLEIRAVDAFISTGVSWKDLRRIHSEAREWHGTAHPFCTNCFATDGQTIFMELRGEKSWSHAVGHARRAACIRQDDSSFPKEH